MSNYNFKGEKLNDDHIEALDDEIEKAGLHAVVGWYISDLLEAYAELGLTITEAEAAWWYYANAKEVQTAMREYGRATILAILIRDQIPSFRDEAEDEQEEVLDEAS